MVITNKAGRSPERLKIGNFYRVLFLRFPRPLPLPLHQFLEAGNIDTKSALACHQFGKVQWKSISVVQNKRRAARENSRSSGHLVNLVEQPSGYILQLLEALEELRFN